MNEPNTFQEIMKAIGCWTPLNFAEMEKLKSLLQEAGIPFEEDPAFNLSMGGMGIQYPSKKDCVCDVILHQGSYGHDVGALEIMGLLTDEEAEQDSVVGWLDAEDVFERIRKHYEAGKA